MRRQADLQRWRGQAEAGVARTSARRYWDPNVGGVVVNILMGEHYVSGSADETLATLLGSCVAACIRDPVAGIGGMNHFLLPFDAAGARTGDAGQMRYGTFAMERLINDVLAAGGRRERLEAKIFGGANVIKSSNPIGDANAQFVRDYLRVEQIFVAAEDLGGSFPRRILFGVAKGTVQRLELKRRPDMEIFGEELSYGARLKDAQVEGTVELFR
ncbi:MAG: chemoreceptor glutamine deamidase CheD [Alphaproteobacteria bacterium]|nr:chemoreceptor glutamine deamidase CheD [Alphaproteobacteria bacterium]